ncbi:MAG: CAP domain-containing protein [Bacteroidales bacterium]|nr:CAP domain-containing protein [Bacteroidales bacterium]
MKKYTKLFALVLLSTALCATFTACDPDDDEPENNQEVINNNNDPAANDEKAAAVFTDEEMAKANTAKDATYLTDDEKLVIFYMNLARLDGEKFTEAYLSDMKGSSNSYEQSLIEDLKSSKNKKMLIPNENLCKASRAHVNDIGPKGLVQHESSDGTGTFVRVAKYYNGGAMAENISFGYSDPMKITRQLLVDDGNTKVGHRKNILGDGYVRIGVAIGDHSKYRSMCVQDFSDAAGD